MSNINFKKTKEKVKYILDNYPNTRDSDKLLYVTVLEFFHGSVNLRDMLDPSVPGFETVSRIRRKFQEQGQFLGTNQVVIARAINQIKMKSAMQGKMKP